MRSVLHVARREALQQKGRAKGKGRGDGPAPGKEPENEMTAAAKKAEKAALRAKAKELVLKMMEIIQNHGGVRDVWDTKHRKARSSCQTMCFMHFMLCADGNAAFPSA